MNIIGYKNETMCNTFSFYSDFYCNNDSSYEEIAPVTLSPLQG